jgi:flagellar hook protein FlgE
MMRCMYSGVSGLKVHQTKMDVIGNNIANVNTIGFKSSSVTFSDILYQTTSSASGPNAVTGAAGRNAKQIGLGSTVSAITSNITTSGGSQRTDKPFDLMIENASDSFFIVSDGTQNYFTKAGSFTTDANGYLCTSSGQLVMGWQVDPDDETKTKADDVSALQIMGADNLYAEPEATTNSYVSGNIDSNDTQVAYGTSGRTVNVQFYDKLGQLYTAEFSVVQDEDATKTNYYTVKLSNVYNEDGSSVFVNKNTAADGTVTYAASTITSFNVNGQSYSATVADDGKVTFDDEGVSLRFNSSTGKFVGIGDTDGTKSMTFSLVSDGGPFTDVDIDFSTVTMFSSGGTSNLESTKGSLTGTGAGRASGNLSGVSIDTEGLIYGTYDNGTSRLLGQVVVASFANPSGLEAVGTGLYATTQNSGDFDGIGKDITISGGKFDTGVVEMSNVDLATEFTEMITAQRGFQANSRTITTADTLLEELINLKR